MEFTIEDKFFQNNQQEHLILQLFDQLLVQLKDLSLPKEFRSRQHFQNLLSYHHNLLLFNHYRKLFMSWGQLQDLFLKRHTDELSEQLASRNLYLLL